MAQRRMSLPKSALMTSVSAISAVALWGLAFPLIQEGLVDFSPVLLGFVRFLLASVLMLAVIAIKYPLEKIVQTIKAEWKPLLILGLLYVAIPNVTQNLGLQHGTSSIASVIQSSGPVMTLLFAVLLLKEGLTRMKMIGTVVAMTGTILLVASGGISLRNQDSVSNVLILISATSYGLAWVSAKNMIARNPPMLVIGLSLLFGTALLGIAVPFEQGLRMEFNQYSILNIAALGFLCAGVSSVLYLSSFEHEEVSRMAFFIYLMPVFASLFAWAIRGEGVASWTAFCGIIIVAGIAIANRKGHESTRRGRAS